MNWKFWQKQDTAGAAASKLPRPMELPSGIGRYLVVNLKYDPDWVWSLKAVIRPISGRRGAFDFRLFEPPAAQSNGVSVRDYTSLDRHPELILFDGWFNKLPWEVVVNDHKADAA